MPKYKSGCICLREAISVKDKARVKMDQMDDNSYYDRQYSDI